MTEPPAEILGRLRPIPAREGPPVTRPHDLVGVRPDGAPLRVEVMEAAVPMLLLFLSAGCLGCRDLWDGLNELAAGLGGAARLAVVTRDPGAGAKDEDPAAIAALAGDAPRRSGVDVVMSTQAFADYRVDGPPFLAVVGGRAVLVEGVAWGAEMTLRTALGALPGAPS